MTTSNSEPARQVNTLLSFSSSSSRRNKFGGRCFGRISRHGVIGRFGSPPPRSLRRHRLASPLIADSDTPHFWRISAPRRKPAPPRAANDRNRKRENKRTIDVPTMSHHDTPDDENNTNDRSFFEKMRDANSSTPETQRKRCPECESVKIRHYHASRTDKDHNAEFWCENCRNYFDHPITLKSS